MRRAMSFPAIRAALTATIVAVVFVLAILLSFPAIFGAISREVKQCSLRCKASTIPWIESGLPDVGQLQDLCCQPLQANREPSMRRHS